MIEQTIDLAMIEEEKENQAANKPKVNFMAKHQQHVQKNLSLTREFVPSKLSNYTVEEPVR